MRAAAWGSMRRSSTARRAVGSVTCSRPPGPDWIMSAQRPSPWRAPYCLTAFSQVWSTNWNRPVADEVGALARGVDASESSDRGHAHALRLGLLWLPSRYPRVRRGGAPTQSGHRTNPVPPRCEPFPAASRANASLTRRRQKLRARGSNRRKGSVMIMWAAGGGGGVVHALALSEPRRKIPAWMWAAGVVSVLLHAGGAYWLYTQKFVGPPAATEEPTAPPIPWIQLPHTRPKPSPAPSHPDAHNSVRAGTRTPGAKTPPLTVADLRPSAGGEA